MKPPKFHVGQAVVCVEEWNDTCEQGSAILPAAFPVKGRIYTIAEVLGWRGDWYVRLNGLVYEWDEAGFAPVELLPDEALAELLAETLEPVTA